MARATSSLPTPVSPVMSTGVRLSATRPIDFHTSSMAGLDPTMVAGSSSA
jgi:hypothetical protein